MPLTEIGVSVVEEYCAKLLAGSLAPSRITEPPAQRRPSPNTRPAPLASWSVPWKKSTEVFGTGKTDSVNVSFESEAEP